MISEKNPFNFCNECFCYSYSVHWLLSVLVFSYLSSLSDWFTSIIRDPASNCITSPDVIIGEIPNSMRVPLRI